jgi:hypothetical protein
VAHDGSMSGATDANTDGSRFFWAFLGVCLDDHIFSPVWTCNVRL